MADVVEATLTLYRGSDYVSEWSLTDPDTGNSLLAAGVILSMVIRNSPDSSDTSGSDSDGVLLTLTDQGDEDTVTGISLVDVFTGDVTVTIRAADIDNLPGLMNTPRRFFHAFKATDSEGFERTFRFGPCDVLATV